MRLDLNLDFENAFDPSRFFFGVANAPFLCEGGYNTPGGPKNNYGIVEATGRMEPSGDTTRFWTDYAAHIRLAASLGLNAFRMGIDWPRIQPSVSLEPHEPPAWDTAALDGYTDIVGMVLDLGMQPIITLYHFTHPAWLGPDLWLDDRACDLLAEYELRVVDEINGRLVARGRDVMRHFLVYNEPNQIPAHVYLGGLFDVRQGSQHLLPAFDNMLSRYIRVYDGLYDLFELRGWGQPHIGYTVGSQAPYEYDHQMADVLRLRSRGVPRAAAAGAMADHRAAWRSRVDDIARSQSTQAQYDRYLARVELTAAAIPPAGLTKTLDALYASPRAKKLDYLSLNVYHPFGGYKEAPKPRPAFGASIKWDEFVMDSEVYRAFILATNDDNDDLPLYMGENSCAHLQPIGGVAKPRPDGWTRERFLKMTLMEVVRCMKEGVPIEGYLYWSLVDDFEWEAGFAPRLGLYAYDYVNHRIESTDGYGEPSGEIYGRLVAALRGGRKEDIQDAFTRTHASQTAAAG